MKSSRRSFFTVGVFLSWYDLSRVKSFLTLSENKMLLVILANIVLSSLVNKTPTNYLLFQ